MEIENIFGHLPILETERLILRKITLDDIQDMYDYCSKGEVSTYVTWETHKTLADTKEFVEFVLTQYEKNKIGLWGIVFKANGKLIGTIDFVSWQVKHRIAELGYVISPDYWGQGITTEAANELIKFGFHQMELIRIQARCFVENKGSERVMEKIGMSFEGTIRKGMLVKGKHADIKMYSILKEEYSSFNM
ncbi:GCN5 family N-acetyltransferase [Alkalihalobacillus alcalophilus ATCC 27647 = CGMCC 1.3604]|uniref:GCN5 family N-acetyltransferase n=1 Tax=Alkalihalobacillus alcalophilus ATCC 27647 = CGMCC 1.3604 TaxID=1218173 RepID=A0A094YYI6_ALKAL|nr:GNAT family protein [Alkalihalobacillus alcalophilus]KGA98602.1 GCN5 family acetyltransferase [Alkalihalobacillus alcalophilus ATCC 27647 = CGMCC 1.3604]MED1560445.1 GNAT family protein [Alkalihalobacillus alcalophilus]THG90893.1 GCN5 family N-acetyltransferase [Alkalihalobacillus alcalophilus ATCC 27647 = CGMCC 1.3604]